MTDLRVLECISLEALDMDWLLTKTPIGIGLDQTRELASAVTVALGTDGLADEDEVLPDPDSTDRAGWWADMDVAEVWGGWPIGCRLWLLRRAKISDERSWEGATLQRAINYSQIAINPFMKEKIGGRFVVTGVRVGKERIYITVTIWRGPTPAIALRYQSLWDEVHPALYEEFQTP